MGLPITLTKERAKPLGSALFQCDRSRDYAATGFAEFLLLAALKVILAQLTTPLMVCSLREVP
jgi:hypothetical protein